MIATAAPGPPIDGVLIENGKIRVRRGGRLLPGYSLNLSPQGVSVSFLNEEFEAVTQSFRFNAEDGT